MLASKTALPTMESGTFLSQVIIQYVKGNILKKIVSKPRGTYGNEPVEKIGLPQPPGPSSKHTMSQLPQYLSDFDETWYGGPFWGIRLS